MFTRRKLLAGAGVSAMTLGAPRSLLAQTKTPRVRPFDVQRFIADCKHATATPVDAQGAIQELLAREISNPGAVLAGVGAPQKGGIQTLYRSDTLTILNIVWAPLMQLIPHEHNMWALIGIYTGREDNIFWRRHERQLSAVDAAAISPGRVIPLANDIIHSVTNPIEKLTGAIHIYGGDFFAVERSEWDPENLTERAWDIQGAIRLFEQSNERFFGWRQQHACA